MNCFANVYNQSAIKVEYASCAYSDDSPQLIVTCGKKLPKMWSNWGEKLKGWMGKIFFMITINSTERPIQFNDVQLEGQPQVWNTILFSHN